MCVVAGCCAEAAIFVQAAEDKVEHAFSGESLRVAKEVQRCEAPVDAAQAEVFGEVVFELVAALLWVSVLVGGRKRMFRCWRTVSRLRMYATCFSTASFNSSGS